jgi:hypothetical protein
MANVSPISIAKGQMMTSAHVTSFARADQGYYVLSGCDVNQAGTPGLSVVVDSGYVQAGFGTARKTVTGGTVTISTPDVTNPRIDVIYVDATGTLGCYAGTPAAISPTSKTDFKEFSTPCPGATIPTGIILALVYVAASETTILNADIWDIASYGPYVVESPTTTTSGKVPTWSSTAKTLSDGYTAGTGAGNLLLLDGSGKMSVTNLASGSQGQSIVQGSGSIAWTTQYFNANFLFGDGIYVITEGQQWAMIPVASKITAAYLESRDSSGALLSGSITCTLYKFTIGQAKGTAVDSFALASASSGSETGLNITVNALDYLMIIVSGITTCKQINLALKMERT